MPKVKVKQLRAIDLYSGVGGWALGLKMAGIEVVASYEKWGAANETNFKNNHHQAQSVDIRRLALTDLPKRIDIVVGSPPCTQFSYANRGGSGDIADGLEDIIKFLKVVKHLKPKAWAMENVPRVAAILAKELTPKGKLAGFVDLGMTYTVVNMENYGLPQRRKRCIAGNFDTALLASYCKKQIAPTLGAVVKALAADTVKDPNYGIKIPRKTLLDHVTEDHLNEEEVRINRAAKIAHPVYNTMPFPDPLTKTVRTITATCTRVSRESVIIKEAGKNGKFRRLTLRERATLQGFPINFQFYGANYSQKQKMVGNAVPPLFSYCLGQAFLGTKASAFRVPAQGIKRFVPPVPAPKTTPSDTPGSSYPWERTFRFAIPSLRLKSGVRFELRNKLLGETVAWEIGFIFGNSKSIHDMPLSCSCADEVLSLLPRRIAHRIKTNAKRVQSKIGTLDIVHMQDVWSHRGPGLTRPFMLLDFLDAEGLAMRTMLEKSQQAAMKGVEKAIKAEYHSKARNLVGTGKLLKNATVIAAGLILCGYANQQLELSGFHRHISHRRKTTSAMA